MRRWQMFKDDTTGATLCDPSQLPEGAPPIWATPPYPAFIQRKGGEYEAVLFDGREVIWTAMTSSREWNTEKGAYENKPIVATFDDRWEALEAAAQERSRRLRRSA